MSLRKYRELSSWLSLTQQLTCYRLSLDWGFVRSPKVAYAGLRSLTTAAGWLSGRMLAGITLTGLGAFNIMERTVDHHCLVVGIRSRPC